MVAVSEEPIETRCFRLLEESALQTSISGSGFDRAVRTFLETIRIAMRADGAALVVRDSNTQAVVIQCAAGIPDLAAEVALSSAGETAAEPGMRTDGGCCSVLGTRLPVFRTLSGALCVGMREERRFASAELRTLEELSARLMFHLETAKRISELEGQVNQLQSEREFRERYVSSVAHDLRGPLATAKMSAQALIGHPERLDERRELAVKIDRNIDRTDRMIRDFLDASRIRAGERLSVVLAECDVTTIAREIVEELVAVHGDRFVVEASERIRGYLSAEELRRAVWNLATNAVKYGVPDRPITITVTRQGTDVLISVHNHGVPISPEEQAKLFQPFARLRTAVNGSRGGWGLGLTLVLGGTAAQGGRVRVRSDAESGTTFTLELPIDVRRYDSRRDEVQRSRLGMH